MSTKGNRRRLRQRLGTVLDERELEPIRFRAVQGNGAGVVKVSGKRNHVYVRRIGRSRIEECLNTRSPARDGLPVIVGYTHEMPDVLQVLEVDWAGMSGLGDYVYLTAHHKSHEFQNTSGGDDVVWVQKQQFLPLLGYPTDPPSMYVGVANGWYPWTSEWHFFAGELSADLSGYVPAGLGDALYVVVSIDGATEDLQYTVGATFPRFLPPVDMESMVPMPPAGSIPVVAIYFVAVMTTIEWSNLYDIRFFGSSMGGSLTPGPHQLLDPSVHDDTSFDDPTIGSLIYGNPATGTASQWDEFLIGATGTYLHSTGMIPVWGPPPPQEPHDLLDGSVHPDTTVDSPTMGSLIYGNPPTGTSSQWDEFLIGASGTYLQSTGELPFWGGLPAAGPHNLLDGSVHPDTAVEFSSMGSLIVGGAPTGTGSVWDEFLIGASGTYLKSTGDFPLWGAAPANGGGGGAPTDAKYVVTEAHADLTAEIILPQLGYYDSDTPPAAAGAYDDEFDDDAIDGAWSFSAGADESFDLMQNTASPHRSETIYHGSMLLQSCYMDRAFTPSISQAFTVVAKFSLAYHTAVNESYGRLQIIGQTSNHYYDVRVGRYNGYDQIRTVYNNGAGAAQGVVRSWSVGSSVYVMITHDGAEHFSSFVSSDGYTWSPMEKDRALSNMNSFTKLVIAVGNAGDPDPMLAVGFVRYFTTEGQYKIGKDM